MHAPTPPRPLAPPPRQDGKVDRKDAQVGATITLRLVSAPVQALRVREGDREYELTPTPKPRQVCMQDLVRYMADKNSAVTAGTFSLGLLLGLRRG